jgi:DNA-binding transcriptional regulator YbjK
MLSLIFVFAGITALSAAAFMVIAVLWLRKLRATVSSALTDSADQQIITAQKLGDALAQVQKQQRFYEQQLHNLAQASLKLRAELTSVSHKLESVEPDAHRGDRTVH